MSEIGVQLGRLRVERQMTQQQLADQTGLRRDTISALERDKSKGLDFATLARLCDALLCTPNDLLVLSSSAHVVPVLGGEDEDTIIAERLAELDLDALIADPGTGPRDIAVGEATPHATADHNPHDYRDRPTPDLLTAEEIVHTSGRPR